MYQQATQLKNDEDEMTAVGAQRISAFVKFFARLQDNTGVTASESELVVYWRNCDNNTIGEHLLSDYTTMIGYFPIITSPADRLLDIGESPGFPTWMNSLKRNAGPGGGGSGSDDDDERGDSESRDGDDETPAAILDAPEYEKMSVACFRKCYDSEFAPPNGLRRRTPSRCAIGCRW